VGKARGRKILKLSSEDSSNDPGRGSSSILDFLDFVLGELYSIN
jgi:hypothetical protein